MARDKERHPGIREPRERPPIKDPPARPRDPGSDPAIEADPPPRQREQPERRLAPDTR